MLAALKLYRMKKNANGSITEDELQKFSQNLFMPCEACYLFTVFLEMCASTGN
jgi:hypothetical protein